MDPQPLTSKTQEPWNYAKLMEGENLNPTLKEARTLPAGRENTQEHRANFLARLDHITFVVGANKGGVVAMVEGLSGFVPFSQISIGCDTTPCAAEGIMHVEATTPYNQIRTTKSEFFA
ncbi:hypothetical protein LguiA_012837 [Lonicera macranthoides]